jgi:hypothetical protein
MKPLTDCKSRTRIHSPGCSSILARRVAIVHPVARCDAGLAACVDRRIGLPACLAGIAPVKVLCRVKFLTFVAARQRFLQLAVSDLPSADQEIEVVLR